MVLKRAVLAVLSALLILTAAGPGGNAFAFGNDSVSALPTAAGPNLAVVAQSAPTAQAVPKRSEIPQQYTWNLESIYANDDLWEADFQTVKQEVPQLAAYKGTLSEGPGKLLDYLKLQEDVGKKLDQLYVYASMRRDENTADNHYQDLANRIETFASSASQATAFMTPELLAMPEEQLRGYMDQEPGLQPYRHVLEDLIRQKAHVRSAEVEELLAQTGEMSKTAQSTFEVLTNAEIKFPTITDENGQQVQLTNANYGKFISSPDRRVRKDAWDALTGTYKQYRNTLAATLSGSIRSDVFSAQARQYGSTLEASLASDNLPVDVYTSLIKAVDDNLGLLHRYMAMRKQILGLDEMHMYDRYVPLLPDVGLNMTYDDAVKTVLAALEPLGPEYVETARQGLASRWVDVYETEGKRNGGYTWGAYTTHPFILMNFQGTLDDVYTLAHELGHAMHFYYMWKNQPYAYSNPSIFTAETASNVHEALLTDYLLKTTSDPKVRSYLLNKEIDSFQGAFFLQALYAEFELETHKRAEAGEALTADTLSKIWSDLGSKYFGPDVVQDEGWAVGWARIPHFYRAYYVYQYCTGLAGADALVEQIVTEGQPAAQRYIDFLKAGGSDYPLELLRGAGVDMASPDPVNKALERFGSQIDQLESEMKSQ